jgi:hypothetical protein
MADNQAHPTWGEIDAVRTGEGSPEHRRHVDSCSTCQAALTRITSLASDLSSAAAPFEIPADIDARILWNARKHAQAARKAAHPVHRRLSGTRWAIAAALILTLGAVGLWQRVRVAPMQVARISADDIDRNGKIDIRDAFVLAKAIENKSDADLAREIEGEELDAGDVDRIARKAVMLGRHG